MAKEKPSIPQGTRDFLPAQVQQRRYILQTLQNVFENFGFLPIETPAIEKLSTLTGKYGEEGDRLIFKILNSGDFLKGIEEDLLQSRDFQRLGYRICEKALRYDLTVPLARFVVMHQNEIQFPFKRYQMQPVWRGDSPQKGRYREFWQCDADIVGSDSLLYEAEFIQMYYDALTKLGFSHFSIHLNHRQILQAIADLLGISNQFIDFCTAIDKLDKISWEGVKKELQDKNIPSSAIEKLEAFLGASTSPKDTLNLLKSEFANHPKGLKAAEELGWILELVTHTQPEIAAHLVLDLALARGLNYYTGFIVEVKLRNVRVGSVGGGGRYDNLTALMGKEGLSGAGISFGIDRIYDAMNELQLFQHLDLKIPIVFIAYFDKNHLKAVLQIANFLRKQNIRTEISPQNDKLGKQIQLADKKGIPYVLIVGEDELQKQCYSLKHLATGEQKALSLEQIADYLKNG